MDKTKCVAAKSLTNQLSGGGYSQAESAEDVGQQAGHQPEDISENETKAVEAVNEFKHKPDCNVRVVFL